MDRNFEANYDNETYTRMARMYLNGVNTEEICEYSVQRYEHKLILLGLIKDKKDD
jgi:hypothetical protein